MPTTTGPMPPPNPYTDGYTNPVSSKETRGSQILKIAISGVVILIILTILCIPQKKLSTNKTTDGLLEMNKQENRDKEPCNSDAKNKKFKNINFYDILISKPEIFIKSKIIKSKTLIIATSFIVPTLFYISGNFIGKLVCFYLFLAIMVTCIKYTYKNLILTIVFTLKESIKDAPSLIKKHLKNIKSEILLPLCIFPPSAVILILLSGILSSLLTGNNPLAVASDSFLYTALLMPTLVYSSLGLLVANAKNDGTQSLPLPDSETSSGSEENPFNKHLISILTTQTKLLRNLFPASIIASFIFVLYHNQELTNGDIGSALEITSAQFPENKIKWATITLLYFLTSYFSCSPALFVKSVRGSLNRDFPHLAKGHPYINYLISLTITAFLTTISNLINIHVIKLITTEDIEINLFLTTILSFTICVFPIRQIIINQIPDNVAQDKAPKASGVTIFIYYILLLISILVSFSIASKIFFEYFPKSIGGVVANPGATLDSEESDYACVFPNDNKSKESITLGIVVESKPESIRIFTPEYNRDYNKYGKQIGEGKVALNKLVETQIKISRGYRVEKYDGSKHVYNRQTGKCEYIKTRYSIKDIFYLNDKENSKKPPRK